MELMKNEQYYGEILSFITYPVGCDAPIFRTGAVTMAIRRSGDADYLVLNNGKPMVYPDRNLAEPAGDIMRSPYLFRKHDGTFALIAANNNSGPFAYIYYTGDLYTYTDERLLKLSQDESQNIRDVYAVYDNSFIHGGNSGAYRVYWRTDTTDDTWHETITDLNEIIKIRPIVNTDRPLRGIQDLGIMPLLPSQEGELKHLSTLVPAREASAIGITKEEYDYISLRIGTRLHNTGVEPFEKMILKSGSSIDLPAQANLKYNDGTAKPISINWNAEQLERARTGGSGIYIIEGAIYQQTYETPLVRYRADPHIFKDPDPCPKTGIHYYYLTGSYPHWSWKYYTAEGYNQIVLRRSPTIQGLAGTVKQAWEPPSINHYSIAGINKRDPDTIPAGPYNSLSGDTQEIIIWKAQTAPYVGFNEVFNRHIWAPEIHKINGRWFILFTSSQDAGEFGIRPAFLVLREGGDPMVPKDWNEIYRIEQMPNDSYNIKDAWMSLDMTYFKTHAGTDAEKDYLTWTTRANEFAIAKVDPQRPWVLKSFVSIIGKVSYIWEWIGHERSGPEGTSVMEGQAVFIKNGTVFMAYSGSAVDLRYSIGMMTAAEGADLLDPASWTKNRFPLLATQDLPKDEAGDFIQSGPGHNSFTFDADGNLLIIYHARHPQEANGDGDGGLHDPGRHAFVKPVQINKFGDIVFYMTPEEELDPANKTVQIVVEKI